MVKTIGTRANVTLTAEQFRQLKEFYEAIAHPLKNPDTSNARRNRKGKEQLLLFKNNGEHYERDYGYDILRELCNNTPAVLSFEKFFTDGNLKLEDVACRFSLVPEANNLAALKAALPNVRRIPRDATFKVILNADQHRQLTDTYQDRAAHQGMYRN